MQKSILSLLQDEVCALANAEHEQRAAEIAELEVKAHREAAHTYLKQAEYARKRAATEIMIAGVAL